MRYHGLFDGGGPRGRAPGAVALKVDGDLAPARRETYLKTALLIIDELGFEPENRAEAGLFSRPVWKTP